MTPKATSEPTAPERVREQLERIRQARLSAGASAAQRSKTEAELKEAEAELRRANEARILAEPGAAGREEEAERRVSGVRMRVVRAAADAEVATRLIRTAQERIERIRHGHPEEFFAEAEAQAEELLRARAEVASVLENYRQLWERALAPWQVLPSTVRTFVEARDRDNGRIRDTGRVVRESTPRSCPISAQLIERVRADSPRPPALDPQSER